VHIGEALGIDTDHVEEVVQLIIEGISISTSHATADAIGLFALKDDDAHAS
jgi:hypothetical protein